MNTSRNVPELVLKAHWANTDDVNISGLDDFNPSDRVFFLRLIIELEDLEFSEKLENLVERFRGIFQTCFDYDHGKYEISVVDIITERGSVRLLVTAIVVTSFNFAINYKDLRENIPAMVNDASAIVRMISNSAVAGDQEKSGSPKTSLKQDHRKMESKQSEFHKSPKPRLGI